MKEYEENMKKYEGIMEDIWRNMRKYLSSSLIYGPGLGESLGKFRARASS